MKVRDKRFAILISLYLGIFYSTAICSVKLKIFSDCQRRIRAITKPSEIAILAQSFAEEVGKADKFDPERFERNYQEFLKQYGPVYALAYSVRKEGISLLSYSFEKEYLDIIPVPFILYYGNKFNIAEKVENGYLWIRDANGNKKKIKIDGSFWQRIRSFFFRGKSSEPPAIISLPPHGGKFLKRYSPQADGQKGKVFFVYGHILDSGILKG